MDPINITKDAETFTSNVFLVPEDPVTLVDAGAVSGVGDDIRTHVDGLDRVIVTHSHGDHVAELDTVVDEFDADVYAFADLPQRDVAVSDGDELQVGSERCEVVHTPGHADDHVSIVGEQRLFSGDVFVYNDGAFDDGSFGRTDLAGQSRDRLIDSLETLLDRMPDSTAEMYAGHGDIYRASSGADELQTVLERVLERARRRQPKYPDE